MRIQRAPSGQRRCSVNCAQVKVKSQAPQVMTPRLERMVTSRTWISLPLPLSPAVMLTPPKPVPERRFTVNPLNLIFSP